MATTIQTPPRWEDILADEEMYFAAQSARATDFNPGSVVRTILEVVAQIQERRDVAVWSSLDRAIDEAVFDAWGFPRQEAIPASGQITLFPGVGVTTPFTIRQGDLFRVAGSPTLIYQATSITINPDGSSGWDGSSTTTVWISSPAVSLSTLNVVAIQPGAAGNVAPKLITEALQTVPGVAQIKNLQAFTNGKDASTDADRRAAFTAYIQSLPRGTIPSLKYGAKTATITDTLGVVNEQVRKVSLVEGPATVPATPSNVVLTTGQVGLFIHNGQYTNIASTALLTKCQQIIDGYTDAQGLVHDGWRAAGIQVFVNPAKEQVQNITINITVATGFQLTQVVALLILAIQNVFNVLDVGQSLYFNDVLMISKLVPGVLDVTGLTVGGITTGSLTPDANGLLTLGTIAGTATQDSATLTIAYPTS